MNTGLLSLFFHVRHWTATLSFFFSVSFSDKTESKNKKKSEQWTTRPTNSPVQKVDNVGMAQVLEDTNLLLDHVLMSLNGLLQNDLDSHIVASVDGPCLLDRAVCSSAYFACRREKRKKKSKSENLFLVKELLILFPTPLSLFLFAHSLCVPCQLTEVATKLVVFLAFVGRRLEMKEGGEVHGEMCEIVGLVFCYVCERVKLKNTRGARWVRKTSGWEVCYLDVKRKRMLMDI